MWPVSVTSISIGTRVPDELGDGLYVVWRRRAQPRREGASGGDSRKTNNRGLANSRMIAEGGDRLNRRSQTARRFDRGTRCSGSIRYPAHAFASQGVDQLRPDSHGAR